MKKKKGFTLRSICGEHFLIAEGLENIDFSNLIVLSESSAYLWESIADDEEFSADTLVDRLLSEYDVDRYTAEHDVSELIELMLQVGIAE